MVERLPAYAPYLNRVKAFLTCDRHGEVITAAWQGMDRVRKAWWLPYSFLRRAGLSVW